MPAAPPDKKLKAAGLIAQNKLSLVEIAKECGVCARTIDNWLTQEDFKALVSVASKAERAARAEKRGLPGSRISDPDYRIRDLEALYDRTWKAVIERGRSDQMQDVPGGKTGMVVVTYKMRADGGGMSSPVPEYKIDTAVSAELRGILQDAAQHLGQWKQKQEISLKVDPVRIENYAALTDDELQSLISLARKLDAPGTAGGAKPPQPQTDGQAVPGDGTAAPGTLPETV